MYSLIFALAYKNAFARFSRSALVIVMIAVSMSMMLSLQGLYDGMSENMIDKNKRSYSGDLSIFAKGYLVDKELKNSFSDRMISQELKNTQGVESYVSRLEVQGLLSTARKSAFISLLGIDLQKEKMFGDFGEFLKEGELSTEKNSALVGLELAKKLKVKLGSKVIFSSQDSSGEIISIAYRVKGIVQTTNIVYDTRAIFVDRSRIQKQLGLKPDQVSQIAMMVADKSVIKKLKSRYAKYDVKSFMELMPMMKQMQELMFWFNSITFLIVMGVVFIGIFGVMYVSVLERIREFGIMLSVGYFYKAIRLQIVIEAIIIGLAGYIIGALIGFGVLSYLYHYGIELSSFSDALEMWGYESTLYTTIKVHYFTNTFIAIIVASLLSVLIPLRKIKKLNPVDVIKVEK